jgi:transposase
MRNVALDLAARKIAFCEVAHQQVVGRRTVSSLGGLEDLLGPDSPPARVAIEACREAWHVHAKLTGWGNQVLLVDTTRVRRLGVGEHGRKTDRIDAEVLARAVERNQIPTAHVLSPQRQRLRMKLSVRRALVETRAGYVTTVRGIVRAEGGAIPSCSVDHFVGHARRAVRDEVVAELIAPLLEMLEQLVAKLAQLERQLEQQCADEPVIALLMTAPQIGVVTAAMFVSVIDDAHRFGSARKVGAYLGLVPSEKSTGDRRRLGSITKQGNGYIRSLLVEVSWSLLRRSSDDPLHRWAKAVAKRRGNRIAVVALARRMAGVLWAMWRDDRVYDPALVGQRSARGLAQQAQDIDFRAAAMKRAADKVRRRARRYRHHLPNLEEVTSS